MSTTDEKNIRKSFLTPCRHLGLRRKSSGPTPPSDHPSSLLNCKAALDTSDGTRSGKIGVEERCDTPKRVLSSPFATQQSNPKKLKKSIVRQVLDVKEDELEGNPKTQTNSSEIDEIDIPADLDFEIDETRQRIAEKLVEVKRLESESLNMKQHDLGTLNLLIQKWREGCQLALTELLTQYTNRGKVCTMAALLQSLGIPFDLVHYSETEMDFNS